MTWERRVGCEDAVIAMPMHPGRRHQGGDPVDQLQRGEEQPGSAIGLRLGQVLAQMRLIDGLETLERKGRARAVIIRAMRAGLNDGCCTSP